MRRITIHQKSTDYDLRYSPSWRSNPWIKLPTVDLRAAGALQATATAATIADPQRAAPMETFTQQCVAEDKPPQKAALSAWEDEGGSTVSRR